VKPRTEHCTAECTATRHSSTCHSRRHQARRKAALRELPDQSLPAYLSDELGLSGEEKVGVELIAKTPIKDENGSVIGTLGTPSMEVLLRSVERRRKAAATDGKPIPKGYDFDGILETAWALPLWQFRKVEAAIQEARIGGRP
jgi:hypothetical protein